MKQFQTCPWFDHSIWHHVAN